MRVPPAAGKSRRVSAAITGSAGLRQYGPSLAYRLPSASLSLNGGSGGTSTAVPLRVQAQRRWSVAMLGRMITVAVAGKRLNA